MQPGTICKLCGAQHKNNEHQQFSRFRLPSEQKDAATWTQGPGWHSRRHFYTHVCKACIKMIVKGCDE